MKSFATIHPSKLGIKTLAALAFGLVFILYSLLWLPKNTLAACCNQDCGPKICQRGQGTPPRCFPDGECTDYCPTCGPNSTPPPTTKEHTGGATVPKCPDGATPTMKGYLGCVQSKYCSAGRYYYGTCFRNAKDMDDGEPSGIKCYAGYTCPSSCNATAPSNVVVKQRLPKS